MNDLIEQALKAAEELADEAHGNGNDWAEWCAPRLELIREALRAAHRARSLTVVDSGSAGARRGPE
jgi:hypothetical protein